MKTNKFRLALGVAVAFLAGPVLAGATAEAGDYFDGGLKGMRGSYVPVPAPVPVPDYRAKWYMRGDAGVGFGVDTSASESGMTYGSRDVTGFAVAPFQPINGFGQDGGADTGSTIGIGAGYYFSNNFRMDITGEILSDKTNDMNGSFQYTATAGANSRIVSGSVSERTTMKSGVFMANAYYDVSRVGNWKPYIGAGVGFAVNELNRTHSTNLTICDPNLGGVGANAACTTTTSSSYSGRDSRKYAYTLAANLTAGVSYRVSDITSLDFNYRYLYIGGTDLTASINGFTSTVDLDDQHEHYLRAGLRFDIN